MIILRWWFLFESVCLKWIDINDSFLATSALPHRCRAQSVGKRKPWLIRTYGFLIQVKMSEPCCIWCHFSLLKCHTRLWLKGKKWSKIQLLHTQGPVLRLISQWPPWLIRFCHHCRVIMPSFFCIVIQPSLEEKWRGEIPLFESARLGKNPGWKQAH